MKKLNSKVNQYLIDGCMRCKWGATPKCKVVKWQEELQILRQIILDSGLTEDLKWSVPVYTKHGKNVIILSTLKDSAILGFFKGVLMKDEYQLLFQQGNLQSNRIIKFKNTTEIIQLKKVINDYIQEAIEIENKGEKVKFKKTIEPLPDELIKLFEQDLDFKDAFYQLSPSKQKGYTLHFSQAKQPATRVGRIEKCRAYILKGIGFNDIYKLK